MHERVWLIGERMERLRPFCPRSRGTPKVDDRRSLCGIIYFQKNGLQWKDALSTYRPPKTLCNRFVCWWYMGVVARLLAEPARRARTAGRS